MLDIASQSQHQMAAILRAQFKDIGARHNDWSEEILSGDVVAQLFLCRPRRSRQALEQACAHAAANKMHAVAREDVIAASRLLIADDKRPKVGFL